ncbi:MAG: SCP2 sterol-binding domain-containing protein [Pseudomonadota bacterium]|nr:SCP2 sterol-binding domain-containing protein [Pseudomonadota bacterium]
MSKIYKPILASINKQIQKKTPALKLSQDLEGKVISIEIRNTTHNVDFIMLSSELCIHPISDEYDVQITGSLLTFVSLLKNNSEEAIIDGSINFDGDVGIGQKFQKLMGLIKPDIEEELSFFVGDIAANGIGKFTSKTNRWLNTSKNILEENISEFLQEERKILPSKYEFNNLTKDINTIRDDIERIEIRVRRALQNDE